MRPSDLVKEISQTCNRSVTVDGALTLRRQEPNTLSIFIMPASLEAASARVAARKCPNEEFRVRRYEAEALAARRFV
jgi:guanylate kinase